MNRYDTLLPRLGAAVLDRLLLVMVSYAIAFAVPEGSGKAVGTLAVAIDLLIFVAYPVLMHWRYGQTVGKRIAKVRVLDLGEAHLPSFRQAVIRDIVPISIYVTWLLAVAYEGLGNTTPDSLDDPMAFFGALVTLWGCADALAALVNQRCRALHDLMAGTIVVRLPAVEPVDPTNGTTRTDPASGVV